MQPQTSTKDSCAINEKILPKKELLSDSQKQLKFLKENYYGSNKNYVLSREEMYKQVEQRIDVITLEREEKRIRDLELANIQLDIFYTGEECDDSESQYANQMETWDSSTFKRRLISAKEYPQKNKNSIWCGIKNILTDGVKVEHTVAPGLIKNLEDKVDEKIGKVESFAEKYIPSMDKVKSFTTPMSVICFCVAAIQWYREGKWTKEIFVAALALLLPEAYSAAKPYILKVWRALTISVDKTDKEKRSEKVEEEDTGYEDQMDLGNLFSNFNICPTTIKLLTGGVSGIILCWIIKDAKTVSNFMERLVKMKDFPNLSNGVYSIVEWFCISFESIVNFIRSIFGYDKWMFWSSEYPDAEAAIKQGYSVTSRFNKKDRLSMSDVQYIERLMKKIDDQEVSLPKGARRELILLSNLKRSMVPLMQRVRRCNVQGGSSRIAPVSIMFCGESAIGKSSCQIAFAKAICARLLPKERMDMFMNTPESEIYAKNGADNYWEGYDGQFMCWHDDIGYFKTVPGVISTESEVIPEMNEVPYNLNMAFELKGKNYFTSDIVLATSNFVKFEPTNLAYPEAFINRWNLPYVVSVDPNSEYCENPQESNPMKRKLKDGLNDVIKNYAHLIFYDFDIRGYHRAQLGSNNTYVMNRDPRLTNFLGKSYKFEEIIENFVMEFRRRRNKSVALMKHQNEIIEHQLVLRKNDPYDNEIYIEGNDTEITPVPGEYENEIDDEFNDPDLEIDEFNKLFKCKDKNKVVLESSRYARNMYAYGSYRGDDKVYYTRKIRELTPEELKRFSDYSVDYNITRVLDKNSKGAYNKDVLELLMDRNLVVKDTGCPVMGMNSTFVNAPGNLSKNGRMTLDYYIAYYQSIHCPYDVAVNNLKGFPPEMLMEYPSLQNPLFRDHLKDIGLLDQPDHMKILGTFIGSVNRVCDFHLRGKVYKAKKVFKKTFYNLLKVSHENLKSMLRGDWLKNSIAEGIKTGLMVVAGLVAVGYTIKGLQKATGMFPIVSGEEMNCNENQSNSVLNVKGMRSRQSIRDPRMRAMVNQSGYDDNMYDKNMNAIVKKMMHSNLYLLYCGDKLLGSVLFIKEYIAVMPKHFRTRLLSAVEKGIIGENDPCRVIPWKSKKVGEDQVGAFSFIPSEKNMILPTKSLSKYDICFLNAKGTGKQPSSPIVDYFVSIEGIDQEAYSFKGSLFKTREANKVEIENFHMVIKNGVKVNGTQTNDYCWSYRGNTERGDCGSIIAIHDITNAKQKIVGFHNNGRKDGMGSGCTIFQESLMDELEELGVEYSTEMDFDTIDFQDESGELNHKVLWSEEGMPMPTYNKICESPVHGKVTEPTKIPVKVLPFANVEGEIRDPVLNALNKTVASDSYINMDIVGLVTSEIFKFLTRVSPLETKGPGRIYSIEEAVAGIAGDPYTKGIPRSTSPGHPYNKESSKKGGGKYLWFGKDEEYDFSNEYFKKMKHRCLEIIEESNKGHRYTFIYYLFGKMETLQTKKIMEDWKLRMIFGAPMDHTIVGRALNMEFFKYIMMNRVHNMFAAGMDVHSKEWTVLAHSLMGGMNIDGDQKGFDGKNRSQFLGVSTTIYNLYYQDDFSKAREIIDLESKNSKLLFRGKVYERVHGFGTGTFDTLIKNGFSNLGLICYSVVKILFGRVTDLDKRTVRDVLAQFFMECYVCVQGDDFVSKISGRFVGKVTFNTLRDAMKTCGYTLTPTDKSTGEAPDYTPFEKLSFLKRTFKKHGDRYIAPLEMESIDNMIQWVNKKKYRTRDFEQVLETYLGELSLHGVKFWNVRFNSLMKAVREAKLTFSPMFYSCGDYLEALIDDDIPMDISPLSDEWDQEAWNARWVRTCSMANSIEARSMHQERMSTLRKTIEEEELNVEIDSGDIYIDQMQLVTLETQLKMLHLKSALMEIKRQELRKMRKLRRKEYKEKQESGDLMLLPEGSIVIDPDLSGIDKSGEEYENEMSEIPQEQSEESTRADLVEVGTGTTNLTFSTDAVVKYDVSQLEEKLRRITIRQAQTKEFFEKKIQVATWSWSTASGVGALIGNIDIDFTLGSTTMWTQKMAGYLNFRGNCVLTLTMNATPFHMGWLRIVWKPYVANDPDWQARDNMNGISIVQISQLPGVYHSVSSDSCQLSVPLIGPQNSKKLDGSATVWNYGYFSAYVVSPLTYTAADTISVAAWMSFEDVEIDTPYYNQMGVTKGSKPETEEKKEKGIISTNAGRLIPVLKDMNSIPMLAPIAGPAMWLTKLLGGAAEAVGWAKPNLSDTMMRVTSNISYYGLNCNGADASIKIAVDATNSVNVIEKATIRPGQDEMSIAFIKRHWSYFATATWTTGTGVGSNIMSIEHRPSAYTQTASIASATGSNTIYYMTPICWMSNLFDNWTGDVELMIHFTKTGFHTGAIAITYVPTTAANALGYSNAPYNMRHILDLQTASEFCVTLPYSLPDPYLPYGVPAGYLSIDVAVPLRTSNAMVAPLVAIWVEVRGAPNMDFQCPKRTVPLAVYVDQGADLENEGCVELDGISPNETSYNIAKSALCVGENITSLKQLISVFWFLKINALNGNWVSWKNFLLPPLLTGVMRLQHVAATWIPSTTSTWSTDYVSSIMCAFMFARGSTRYSISTTSSLLYGSYTDIVPGNSVPAMSGTNQVGAGNTSYYGGQAFVNNPAESSIILNDPYYNKYPVTMVRPTWSQTQTFGSRYGPNHSTQVGSGVNLNFSDGSAILQRAAGEDFQLSFFLSVPTMAFFPLVP